MKYNSIPFHISIGVIVLLILLIIVLTIYICKYKGSTNATVITENESYGKFIDYGEYCEEKKKNIISDGNEYYEE